MFLADSRQQKQGNYFSGIDWPRRLTEHAGLAESRQNLHPVLGISLEPSPSHYSSGIRRQTEWRSNGRDASTLRAMIYRLSQLKYKRYRKVIQLSERASTTPETLSDVFSSRICLEGSKSTITALFPRTYILMTKLSAEFRRIILLVLSRDISQAYGRACICHVREIQGLAPRGLASCKVLHK